MAATERIETMAWDTCSRCGRELDARHDDAHCRQMEQEHYFAACEQSGHMLQGDTCYCGANVHPSCR